MTDGMLSVSLRETIYVDGMGSFIQTGGINSTNGLSITNVGGSNDGYNLSGTGQIIAQSEFIGENGNGIFTQTAGTNTTNNLYIHSNNSFGYCGTYNLSGPANSSEGSESIGDTGRGEFTQTGGTNCSFTIDSGTGTYNLKGGTLIVNSIVSNETVIDDNYTFFSFKFNFGGGTIQASRNMSTRLPLTLTGDGGNANIDTVGYSLTLSGVLSDSGGLNKLGSGTLTLNAPNSYKGNTFINAGKLALTSTGSIGFTPIIDVLGGATFDTSAKNSSGGFTLGGGQKLMGGGNIIGNIIATSGSHIAPGDSAGRSNHYGQSDNQLRSATGFRVGFCLGQRQDFHEQFDFVY